MNQSDDISTPSLSALYTRIEAILSAAKTAVARSVNSEMVKAYWLIGQQIVEEEQNGQARAQYGEEVIEQLSARLQETFGKGYGRSQLRSIRQFYLTYSSTLTTEIQHAVRGESPDFSWINPDLSWTHYRLLCRVSSSHARSFYEIEAAKNRWSSRELERQINSLLFERLAMSDYSPRLKPGASPEASL